MPNTQIQNTKIQIHKYTNTLLLKREHLSLEEDGEALTCQALHSEFCLHILLHSDGPSTFPTLPPEGSVATPIPVSCFPSFTLHSEERNTMRKVSKLLHLSSLVWNKPQKLEDALSEGNRGDRGDRRDRANQNRFQTWSHWDQADKKWEIPTVESELFWPDWLREDIGTKKTFQFGHCPNFFFFGGGSLPLPEFFWHFFDQLIVPKKVIFYPKLTIFVGFSVFFVIIIIKITKILIKIIMATIIIIISIFFRHTRKTSFLSAG